MSEILPVAVKPPSPWYLLIAGPGGVPDESTIAFMAMTATHIFCTIYRGFEPSFQYDGLAFVGAGTGLLAFYQASIRVRRGGAQGAPDPNMLDSTPNR